MALLCRLSVADDESFTTTAAILAVLLDGLDLRKYVVRDSDRIDILLDLLGARGWPFTRWLLERDVAVRTSLARRLSWLDRHRCV